MLQVNYAHFDLLMLYRIPLFSLKSLLNLRPRSAIASLSTDRAMKRLELVTVYLSGEVKHHQCATL